MTGNVTLRNTFLSTRSLKLAVLLGPLKPISPLYLRISYDFQCKRRLFRQTDYHLNFVMNLCYVFFKFFEVA
jgi:hypothetical protein